MKRIFTGISRIVQLISRCVTSGGHREFLSTKFNFFSDLDLKDPKQGNRCVRWLTENWNCYPELVLRVKCDPIPTVANKKRKYRVRSGHTILVIFNGELYTGRAVIVEWNVSLQPLWRQGNIQWKYFDNVKCLLEFSPKIHLMHITLSLIILCQIF